MKNNLLYKKSFGLIASLLATISLLAVAATPVFAKPLSPVSVPTIKDNLTTDQLSAMFGHERTLFNNLDPGADIRMSSLTEAEKIIADREKFDAQLGNLGTASQRALPLREQAVNQAINKVKSDDLRIREQVSIVKSLLAAHAGFDGTGNVTNSSVALQTVKSINAYLANLQYFIKSANSDLSKVDIARIRLSNSSGSNSTSQ